MTSTHDASARSDFAGIQALLSREPGYAVARECLAVQSAAEARDPSLRSEHGVRLAPDAWSWYVGALGEIEVGALLSQLSSDWFVRHAVPIGAGATDVDHLLIGPNGIFVLNTKRHLGANVWVGDHVMRVNGSDVHHVRAARNEATNVSRRLSAKLGFPVMVHSAIVTVGERSLKDSRDPSARTTAVVSSHDLLDWIRNCSSPISPTSLELARLAAEEPETWHVDPHAADTLRVMPRFQRLRSEVGDRPPSPHAREVAPRVYSGRRHGRRPAAARPSAPRRPAAARESRPTAARQSRPVSRFEKVVKALVVGLFLIPMALVIGIILLSELVALAASSL